MKVLSFGSLNIDYVYEVEHFVRPKETMSSLSMQRFMGGKGLNQSIALSRAGANVYHAGAVGKADGNFLINKLIEDSVNVDNICQLDISTGHAIIQLDKYGENCILLYGGANIAITREQIDKVISLFDKGDFIVLQNEINNLDYIITAAKAKGMVVVLNPSPMNDTIKALPLELVDYFILNEVEAMDICELKQDEGLDKKLIELYPKARIVLTLGEKGSIYRDTNSFYKQDIFKVEVVDTTAAGDTFTGYFIASLIMGLDIPDALERASKAASIAVGIKGAASSIPRL